MMTGGDEHVERRQHSLWQNREYLLLVSGQTVSQVGTQISQSAGPLLVLLLTGSAAWAGLVFGMVLVPNLLLSLPAGALVDRWNRKRVMIVSDLLRILALGSIPVALAFGRLTLLQVCAAALVEGTGAVFFGVAETASLPAVIDESHMGQAAGQQQAAFNLSLLFGPMLAGITLSIGRAFPYLLDVCSYLFSVVSLCFIKKPFQATRREGKRVLIREIREGMHWVWNDAFVRLCTILAGISSGIDNSWYLLVVVIATTRLHTPIALIGVMVGIAAGLGGFVGALLSNRLERAVGLATLTRMSSWVRVLLLLLLLLAPNIVVVGSLLFLDGIAQVAPSTALYAARLLRVPEALQGRVTSVYKLVSYACPLLFIWGAGVALQYSGTMWTILILAAIAAGTALMISMSNAIGATPTSPARSEVAVESEGV